MRQRTYKSGLKNAASAMAIIMVSAGLLAACGGGGGGGGATVVPPPPPPPPPPATVTVSGLITYDRVPLTLTNSGLNFAATTTPPARGVTVQVVDTGGTVLDSDTTDATGNYSVTVDSNTDVRVQVRAEIIQTAAPIWNVQVLDNTSSNALYVLAGNLTSSGAADSTRNLNAASGWGATSYTATRAAAPFAILDNIYESVTDFAVVDPAITFPNLQVFWSINNVASSGAGGVPAGEIGTSSYTQMAGIPTIRVLGDAANDTDEFDDHVIVHEWGHYFEDQISRSDSIGGAHGGGDRLDPRVAFGEGWGNALSAMLLDDPVYRDSGAAGANSGFSFSMENNNYTNEGWFNEGSIQSILYDVFDTANDGPDVISAGLGPIYTAFTSTQFTTTPTFTTIFSFRDVLKDDAAISAADLTALLTAQSINGTGDTGVGETNAGGIANALPVYKPVTVGGAAVIVCSVDDAGTANKLGVREYLTFTVATAGSHTLRMQRRATIIGGGPSATARDPDFIVRRNDQIFSIAQSPAGEFETVTVNLNAGLHVVEAYDDQNVSSTGTSGDACYDFTVQ